MLCVQLGTLEAQIARNRTDLEIQLRRIAQLQDEVEILKRSPRAPGNVSNRRRGLGRPAPVSRFRSCSPAFRGSAYKARWSGGGQATGEAELAV